MNAKVTTAIGGMLAAFLLTTSAFAADTPAAKPEKLVVATKLAAPFSMQDASGEWQGISIELWRLVAEELHVDYEFRPMELKEMLSAVQSGGADVAVAAITVTEEREVALDFTHPYFSAGLSLAFKGKEDRGLLSGFSKVFTWQFFSAVGVLVLVVMLAAVAVWFFERKANEEQFGGPWYKGLANSFWWSAVTMTTVGYGDKSPQSLGGRAIALVWMFASIVIVSGLTAAIASSLTVNSLGTDLTRAKHISQLRIGAVDGSTGEQYLQEKLLAHTGFNTLDDAIAALSKGEVDAVLHDLPILQYLAQESPELELEIRPGRLTSENYAIAVPSGSPLRERINVALLKVLAGDRWAGIRFKYLGD